MSPKKSIQLLRTHIPPEIRSQEHNQKKLHEIDSFEDREHYRQLRLNREVVTRCKQLRQRRRPSRGISSEDRKVLRKALSTGSNSEKL